VPAKAASTGIEELRELPENAAGFAQAIVRLRNKYASNVLLAYHMSTWGTGEDPTYSDPPADLVRRLANRSAAFYLSLNTDFDLTFAEFSGRDAEFEDKIYRHHGASRGMRQISRGTSSTCKSLSALLRNGLSCGRFH
jgi:hypothetical protein